jgi:hypothetical protein
MWFLYNLAYTTTIIMQQYNTLVAVNQDNKKNNHAQEHKSLSWENPSQSREKPSNPLLIFPRGRSTIHHQTLAHKRVPYN